jgi:FkbM family methyltransferase
MTLLEKSIVKYKSDIFGVTQVGAGTGQEVNVFTKNNITNVYLFEPQMRPFENLKNYKDKNIHLFNYGLGNENKEVEMFTTESNTGASSSILSPKLHSVYYPEIVFSNKVTIEIKRYASLEGINANFLVLDVQGYELEVLKGFDEKIKNYDFIYTEISRKKLYDNGVLIADLDLFLKKKGFIRSKTSWVSNKPTGDALYIKMKGIKKYKLFMTLIKSKFTNNFFYFGIIYFKDLQKVKYTLKQLLRKTLIVKKYF